MRKLIAEIISVLAIALMVLLLGSASVQAKDVTPSTLTIPYTGTAPTIDGNISAGEYDAAAYIHWSMDGLCGLDDGDISIYAMNDGHQLYIAIDAAYDTTNNLSKSSDNVWISFDLNNDNHMDTLSWDTKFTGEAPYDDTDFTMYEDNEYIAYGELSGGGQVGFAKTNLSADKHRIYELEFGVDKLPVPGDYFGVFIWGEAQQCPLEYNTKFPNTLLSLPFVGFAYPDDVMTNNDLTLDPDTNPMDVSNFAEWTLEAPHDLAPVKVDKFPAFLTWFFISVLGISAVMVAMKDDVLSHKNMLNIVLVVMVLSLIGLGLLYYYGLLAFS